MNKHTALFLSISLTLSAISTPTSGSTPTTAHAITYVASHQSCQIEWTVGKERA